MLIVADKQQSGYPLRLTPQQRRRLERLARLAGRSLNDYIAAMIDVQYESFSEDELQQLERAQGKLLKPVSPKKLQTERQGQKQVASG